MKKTLILAGIVLSASFYSQRTPEDFTIDTNDAKKYIPKLFPTSPESFKFSMYGNIPIGMFTGAPNINIPITELSVDGTSIPIFLNYSSNGINVDEMNGSVGLGWTFISGGVITRTIRDRPDEENSFNSGDVPLTENFSTQLTEYLKFCENNDFDSEPDLYTANFGGHNIKFLINKSGNIVMIDQKDYQIKRNDNGSSFSIISDNGIQYNFNAIEHIQNRTFNTDHQPPQEYIQSWYLTSIDTTTGQTLTLEYQPVNYTNILSKSQTMTYTQAPQSRYGDLDYDGNNQPYCAVKSYTIPPDLGLISDTRQTVDGKQLKRIYDSNNNSIVFSYSAQNGDYSKLINIKKYHNDIAIDDYSFNYITTSSLRLFLSEIHNNKTGSSYQFTYYNQENLPPRLSFSRDMWGYYNGKTNTNLVPQLFVNTDQTAPRYNGAIQSVNPDTGYYGLLKNITYPTGGNTLLNYENHKIKQSVLVPAEEISLGASTVNNFNTRGSTKELSITSAKEGYIRIGLTNELYTYENCTDSPDLKTGKQRGEVWVKDQSGNSLTLLEYEPGVGYISVGQSARSSLDNKKELYVYVHKNQTVSITVKAWSVCCEAYVQVYYYDQEDRNTIKDVLLGGYRISSTVDNLNDGLVVTKNYNYIRDNGEYSINVTRDPVFKEDRTVGSVCTGSTNTLPLFSTYTAITSSNIGRLFSFNPNIFYDSVEEQIEGNGKIIHHYSSEKDYWGNPLKGSPSVSAPWTNFGWNNGKELSIVYKNNTGAILKTVENNYVEDLSRTSYLGAISRRKIYEPLVHDGTWNNFENMDVLYYKNISRFTYLQSQKITDYFSGTPVETRTEYFYNNPSHYQLNKQKETLADGTVNETNYSYAHEKNNQLLISKDMVGIPLETTTTQSIGNATKLLSRSETVYPKNEGEITNNTGNLVLPLSVVSYHIQNNTPSMEIIYDKYDSKGNIEQYTTKDGISTVIIWGYNKTKPIAKIENAKLTDINQTLVNALVIASDADAAGSNNDETALLNAFKTFRSSLPGYQITTYSYDPLIGIRSLTPPSGITEFYTYDSAGRLEKVVDANGKLLKDYQYKYKP